MVGSKTFVITQTIFHKILFQAKINFLSYLSKNHKMNHSYYKAKNKLKESMHRASWDFLRQGIIN
jgi:hypothetical protein